MRDQCRVICLPAWISVAWGVVPGLGKHKLKPWEWTPASLGVSRTPRWKFQQMEVAAWGACRLCPDSPPEHVGATVSKGISSPVGCWAGALLAVLLWSGHLMRTFGLRRWRFLHGRLSWAAGMHCQSPIRWFSAALIWSVCDREDDMKVHWFFQHCIHELSSWQQHSLQPGSLWGSAWAPSAAPAFPQAVGAAPLALLGPVLPWVFSCSPCWEENPCRAVGEGTRSTAVPLGCAAGSWWPSTWWEAAPHLLEELVWSYRTARSSSQMVSPVVWVFSFLLLFCCCKIWRLLSVRQLLSATGLFKVIDFPLTLEFGIVSKYCCQLHADSSPLRLKSFHLWPQAGLVFCSHGN